MHNLPLDIKMASWTCNVLRGSISAPGIFFRPSPTRACPPPPHQLSSPKNSGVM